MLVDTSVWVDHFRRTDTALVDLLDTGAVECHPFVIGELACGFLRKRQEIIDLLETLPQVGLADHHEALALVSAHRLAGSGIGWVDVHLLAAARLARTRVWTRDRRLRAVATRLGLSAGF